ncbi:DsbA family protein [Shimia biformata]|uniref:DsbA family protein n=1 Tax=Shimia biformata TaxID=1294299 RepID=UPI00194DB526|nr:DsbA family protein [Shimia biformata]
MKFLATTAAALCLTALPAAAFDIDKMSDSERAAFRAEIRAYLLENPEVIFEAVEVMEQRQAQAEAAQDIELVTANADAIFNDGFSWVGGNPEGDITLVEFIDYRCGYCRKAHDEVVELIESDGNIRFIVKEFPILGEGSVLSSRFAIAVKHLYGDEAYEAAHNALIKLKQDATKTTLGRLAESLGHDKDALFAAMDTDKVNEELNATRALAQRLRISGTPTFVMQDDLLRGYLPLQNMQALVAQKRG